MSFREFVEKALYDPACGYYATARNPVGRGGDFVTSGAISPVFGFALTRLAEELVERTGDGMYAIVDIGCGDGSLIRSIAASFRPAGADVRFIGVDRALARTSSDEAVDFVDSIDAIPPDRTLLLLSNELFDALPFARLVMREEGLKELWVEPRGDELEWCEREAPEAYVSYFAARGIELEAGQFADVSLAWSGYYEEIARRVDRGMIVTFDYGHESRRLFDARVRRFGTAGAYAGQRFNRDLLANPGGQDLTAQINFSDLIEAGTRNGLTTLAFTRQARFLLSIGILEHPLLQPAVEVESGSVDEAVAEAARREAARRLILPDGIGDEMRVLVQSKGIADSGWSFQEKVF